MVEIALHHLTGSASRVAYIVLRQNGLTRGQDDESLNPLNRLIREVSMGCALKSLARYQSAELMTPTSVTIDTDHAFAGYREAMAKEVLTLDITRKASVATFIAQQLIGAVERVVTSDLADVLWGEHPAYVGADVDLVAG